MRLDPFYPIFDSSEWLSRLLPLGIKFTQLRIKGWPEDKVRREVQVAKCLADEYGCLLVVNDYWEIALDEGCDFVHLGQADLEGADIPALKNAIVKIGISTHSEEELEHTLSIQPDYIALGPIYPTILKKMDCGPQGLQRLGQWKQRIGSIPLIGIGGVNLNRAPGMFEAGADVVSMVTDISLNENPKAQVLRWLKLTSNYR